MSQFDTVTPAQIEEMDFSSLVGIANEPNMPSGGAATIRRVLEKVPAAWYDTSRLLEVGSNTGFTCVEMASWVRGRVTGVDINPISIDFSRKKAAAAGIGNVEFIQSNATGLDFPDATFDLVFCSNVTSFVRDREQAIAEYYRVLKPLGVLAAAPIYYHSAPPADLLKRVEAAVGAPIPVRGKDYWTHLFQHPDAELYFDEEYEYIYQTPERIAEYVAMVMDQAHIQQFSAETQQAIARRLTYFYEIFNDNLQYARYSILLYRLGAPNRVPILHETRRAR
jgi:ubiquinone/menaquinone biosynthesis C-methylase UbiE